MENNENTSLKMENNENTSLTGSFKIFGRRIRKPEIVFIFQVIILYIVIITQGSQLALCRAVAIFLCRGGGKRDKMVYAINMFIFLIICFVQK